MIRWPALAAVLAAAALLGLAPDRPAEAQQLLTGQSGDLQIEAAGALEWQSEQHRYVASGNAVVHNGDTTIRAATLIAEYRDRPEGGTEVWRVTGSGGVVIETPSERAQSAEAVYDIDSGRLVLTGGDLQFKTATETITAEDSLEYNQKTSVATARGHAVAVRGTDELRADVLTARFRDEPGGTGRRLSTITAEGNVHLRSAADVASGDAGVYDAETQTATLTGGVSLTSGQNHFTGERAEVNLATGVSRLTAGNLGDRVRALLTPNP